MSVDAALRSHLAELAAFLPLFESPGFEFGSWHPLEHTRAGVTLPTFELDTRVRAFVEKALELGFSYDDADWQAWIDTPEGARMQRDPASLSAATPDQLARLLVALVRRPPFEAGGLVDSVESGLLVRALQRAAALRTQ